MSTRCNIYLHDFDDVNPSVILYHHTDGYPDFMFHKLTRFVDNINTRLKDLNRYYWWDAERVGAMMIQLSAGDYTNPEIGNDVPQFQPCIKKHGDIDYLYHIYLLDDNKYKITVDKQ